MCSPPQQVTSAQLEAVILQGPSPADRAVAVLHTGHAGTRAHQRIAGARRSGDCCSEEIVVVGRRPSVQTAGWGSIYGFIIETLEKGSIRKAVPIVDKAEAVAVAARQQEKNVMFRSQQAAAAVEKAANRDQAKILRHEGAPVEERRNRYPHYQTKGVEGHSFWGGLEDVLDLIIPFPPIFLPDHGA